MQKSWWAVGENRGSDGPHTVGASADLGENQRVMRTMRRRTGRFSTTVPQTRADARQHETRVDSQRETRL